MRIGENNVILTDRFLTRGGGFCLYSRGFNRRLHLRQFLRYKKAPNL